jgi:hypothetical protein
MRMMELAISSWLATANTDSTIGFEVVMNGQTGNANMSEPDPIDVD